MTIAHLESRSSAQSPNVGQVCDDGKKGYRMPRLEVTPTAEGYVLTGDLRASLRNCMDTLASVQKCKTGELRFRARVAEGGAEHLEMTRV